MGELIDGSFGSYVDRARSARAAEMPHRREFFNPLDNRLESVLGRLAVSGRITAEEYRSAESWRTVHLAYIRYIHEPDEFSDSEASDIEDTFNRGRKILEGCGRRVFHAVSAVATYDEPEELGDFEFTAAAAKIGFAALAKRF